MKGAAVKVQSSGIFIRENGETKEISEKEWFEKHPYEPVKYAEGERETDEVYSANITHNLITMAEKAGIYEHLWRPDEINITKASQLIEPLKEGLDKLKSEPDKYKKFNPENGWGNYEGLVRFVENYLNACIEYPDADVDVSR
jgi:hypothetical protein